MKRRIIEKKAFFRICFSIVILTFAIAYSLTSIVPHILFRTYALDLGMFNHALYNYAHLRPAHFTLAVDGTEIPYLGDHFSPITMLYAPFYYLFGSYTLLIIQILAILFGGYGIFIYSKFKGLNKWLSLLLMTHFYTLWAIFSALSYDFHNNVVAAMLIPWFFLHYEKGNIKQTLLFFILILIAKENMALWMSFILLGLLLLRKGNTLLISRKITLVLVAFSIIYFLVVILVIMPSYSHGLGTNQLARYNAVEGKLSDVILSVILNPGKYFSLLFEDTLSTGVSGVKSGFWFMFLISGGFALIHKPQYLLMIIPIIAQKMFSNNYTIWGTMYQYSIELAPIISIALVAFLSVFKSQTGKFYFLVILIFTSYFYNKDELRESNIPIFRTEHYKTNLDVKEINKALELIPDSEAISVSSQLAPHLAFRKVIRQFPIVKDSKYIIILKKGNAYPLNQEQFDKSVNQLLADSSNVVYNSDNLLIYHVLNHSIEDYIQGVTYDSKKLKEIEDYIKSSHEWYKQIEEKAKKLNMPVDSVLRNDAKWVYRKKLNESL